MTPVAPRIVNDVSYARRIKQSSHFAWQSQYLVKFRFHISWQAQYLVKFQCHISWQVQYLVKFKRHFSWQVQYLVAGAARGECLNVRLGAKRCIFQ